MPVLAHSFSVGAGEDEFITGPTPRFDFLSVVSLTVQAILVGTVDQVNWDKEKKFRSIETKTKIILFPTK